MINNKHEKLAIVRERFEPGKSVSMVTRQHGVNANQLFRWCKLYQDGSLSAVNTGEKVVPASKLSDALKQIKELQRLIGKKAMENEMLREAAEVMKWRKWIARSNVAVKLARPADGHDDGAAQSGTRQVHGQPRRRLGTRMLAR